MLIENATLYRDNYVLTPANKQFPEMIIKHALNIDITFLLLKQSR